MKYVFEVGHASGALKLAYDSRLNTLDGAGVPPNFIMGQRDGEELRINIVMGTACNYRCGYCCQADMKKEIFSPLRLDAFVRGVRDYCDRHFCHVDAARVLFWGGEPLLYFDMMKELAAGLRDVKPRTLLGICSNGALLNEENLAWLHDNHVGVGFSYDGPGQSARDESDVLAPGSFALEALKDGVARHHWSVNPVFHRKNPLVSRFIDFMDERLGSEEWAIGDVQMLMVGDEASAAWALSEKELYAFSLDCCRELFIGRGRRFAHAYVQAAKSFLRSLGQTGGFGGCQNAQPGALSLNVDITGNVWACHSFAGKHEDERGGNLHMGTLEGPRRPVKLAVLESRRERACMDCVMRMFCGGGCLGTPEKYDEVNCLIQWHKWFPALSMAVNMLTGGQLLGVKRLEA